MCLGREERTEVAEREAEDSVLFLVPVPQEALLLASWIWLIEIGFFLYFFLKVYIAKSCEH